MSTAIMPPSALFEYGDLFLKNQTRPVQTMTGTMTGNLGPAGATNIGGGWEQHPVLARAASVPAQLAGLLNSLGHRRLERTASDPAPPPPATSRYKTELCRPFEEAGVCKYGDKCQFAHGVRELRNLQRHPKYKTELCRTFHSVGFCPYGPRCHFVHNAEEARRRDPPSPGGSVASLSSGGSQASSYGSDGSRSPRSPHSPHSPQSPHSPLTPQSPLLPHSPPSISPPAHAPAFPFRRVHSPDPEEERLPVFNRLSSAFGDLVIA
ncbi:protein TIS11 [Aricia agestis]|uniref:protein TIS11 n=1 Tax=Aricia agestis TaxID=91739 RepID=UPI001C20C0C7|nr:protein TIS11 [Aricia agestis]